VRLAEDQHTVQELTAQGTDEPLANRVHPRSLNSGAQDRDAAGLEDRIERGREVGAAVTDQEPVLLENRILALTWAIPVFRRLARTR
jgi:hypothetical protein